MFCIEGIDKIKIIINPLFLNPLKRKVRHIDPKNRLTLHPTDAFQYLSIQAEYINLFIDMRMNIALAIYDLIKKDFFVGIKDTPYTLLCVYKYLEWFVLSVQEIEFFFDFKRDDVVIDEEELDPNVDNDDKRLKQFDTTFYSDDYIRGKRYSLLKLYDRESKLIHDKATNIDMIKKNPYKSRIEFRLTKGNCDYVELDNLNGTYNDIIKRYTPLLAIIYHNYFKDVVRVYSYEHKKFNIIYELAKKNKTRYRGSLQKSKPISKMDIRKVESDRERAKKMTIFQNFLNDAKKEKERDKLEVIDKVN